MKSNHEMAENYRSKAKLIGKDILEFELLDGDRVLLTGVKDKGEGGRLVIPSFITDYNRVNKSGYIIERSNILHGATYEEVYIDNRAGIDIDISYLCSEMVCSKIKIVLRHPECIIGIKGLFRKCENLVDVDISGVDIGRVIDLSWLFFGCRSLRDIDISSWDISGIESMESMFSGCKELEDIKFNKMSKTNKLKDINNMFSWCSSLKSIDLSWLDVSSVKNMSNLFNYCSRLYEIDISNWDTSSVENMGGMFNGVELILSG